MYKQLIGNPGLWSSDVVRFQLLALLQGQTIKLNFQRLLFHFVPASRGLRCSYNLQET